MEYPTPWQVIKDEPFPRGDAHLAIHPHTKHAYVIDANGTRVEEMWAAICGPFGGPQVQEYIDHVALLERIVAAMNGVPVIESSDA